MKGLVRARPTTKGGRIYFGCGPPIFPDMSVPASNNEPELPLREAIIAVLALAAFLALMAWAAMQGM